MKAIEQSWQLDETGQSGMGTDRWRTKCGSTRRRAQATTGEAWVATHGKAMRIQMKRTKIDHELRAYDRRIVNFASSQAAQNLATGIHAEPQKWWEVDALPSPPKTPESGPDGSARAWRSGTAGSPPAPLDELVLRRRRELAEAEMVRRRQSGRRGTSEGATVT